MINLRLTNDEANYLKSILNNSTVQNQAIMKKNEELAGFFSINNKINGSISKKITNAKKSNPKKIERRE